METSEHNSQSFSLLELNQHLKRVVAFNMRTPLWLRCEISSANYNRGFVYMQLVDRDDYSLRAKASAVLRPRELEKIKKRIGDALWTILQAGQQVLMQVGVEFSELYGLSLVVNDLDTAFTIGQQELQRMTTLKRLEEEQFLELNHQLDLPLVPQRIAVISSKDAAGLQDFLQQLHNNPHHYAFQTELFQAAVQGVNVAKEVIQQIETIEAQQAYFDCIVIVRGGGARLDLMGFDDFEVCKAVAACELPVLTGIGHDVDETLVDLVAHTAMKTPTAVAEFLIQQILNFEMSINRAAIDLQQVLQRRLQNELLQLDKLQQRLEYTNKIRFQEALRTLDSLEQKLDLLLPEKTLARGFALLSDTSGKPINSIHQVATGQTLYVQLKDGVLKVVVNDE